MESRPIIFIMPLIVPLAFNEGSSSLDIDLIQSVSGASLLTAMLKFKKVQEILFLRTSYFYEIYLLKQSLQEVGEQPTQRCSSP